MRQVEDVVEIGPGRAMQLVDEARAAFDADKHPRDKSGKFGSGSGGKEPEKFAHVQDFEEIKAFRTRELAASARQFSALSPKEQRAVFEYTGQASGRMNWEMGQVGGDVSKLSAPVRARVEALTAALDKTELKTSAILYRFAKTERLASSSGEIKVGSVVTDNGFVSTSVEQEQAREFSRTGRSMLVLKAPKGSKGLFVGDESRSKNPYENEVILQRGTRYRITKVEKGFAIHTVHATVLPPEKPKKGGA